MKHEYLFTIYKQVFDTITIVKISYWSDFQHVYFNIIQYMLTHDL